MRSCRVSIGAGLPGVLFALGRTGHLFTNVFNDYEAVEVPLPDPQQAIDVHPGHWIGDLKTYVNNRKGISTLRTCNSAAAIYMQGYYEEILATPQLYCVVTNATRRNNITLITTDYLSGLYSDFHCDTRESNVVVFMAYRPNLDVPDYTSHQSQYGMLWLMAAAPDQAPGCDSSIWINGTDLGGVPKDSWVARADPFLRFLRDVAYGDANRTALQDVCPQHQPRSINSRTQPQLYSCGWNSSQDPKAFSKPWRSYQQVRGCAMRRYPLKTSIYAMLGHSSRDKQVAEPCLLLPQAAPEEYFEDTDATGNGTIQTVGAAMASSILSTSSARLYDIRVASLKAMATYYTTSAAVTATVPGLMAAAGLSILDIKKQLMSLISTLHLTAWVGRQTPRLRTWLSMGMAAILHTASALPSIVFLVGSPTTPLLLSYPLCLCMSPNMSLLVCPLPCDAARHQKLDNV